MLKSFLIINPHNEERIVPENLAFELRGQVKIIGEVLDVQYKKGEETISRAEFMRRCVKRFKADEGGGRWKIVREIEPGWEQFLKIDKNSRPREPFRQTMNLDTSAGMREVPKVEWLRMKGYGL